MKAVPFKEANVLFARDQKQYNPLTAFKDESGVVVSCWELSWLDKMRVLFTGKVWLKLHTFNQPLQPQLLQTEYPFEK